MNCMFFLFFGLHWFCVFHEPFFHQLHLLCVWVVADAVFEKSCFVSKWQFVFGILPILHWWQHGACTNRIMEIVMIAFYYTSPITFLWFYRTVPILGVFIVVLHIICWLFFIPFKLSNVQFRWCCWWVCLIIFLWQSHNFGLYLSLTSLLQMAQLLIINLKFEVAFECEIS